MNLKKFSPPLQYAAQAKLMSSRFYRVSKSSRNREKRPVEKQVVAIEIVLEEYFKRVKI